MRENPIIEDFLVQNEKKDLLRFSTAGSIDDGKSTLIGRLLHDSKMLYEDHISAIKKITKNIDEQDIDYALFTDGLKAEREQGITIDVAYRYFSTPKRKFIIADTPGHQQYTRNMATGASTADLAVILIDARNGVLTQTKRHAFISSLLGVSHLIVAINKMDLVDYDEKVFNKIKDDFSSFAQRLEVNDLRFIPISALKGDNVVHKSSKMDWHKGESLLEFLENIYVASDKNLVDLRFPVQYVLRPDQSFRGYCGTIASGVISKDDKILILPSMKKSKVQSIVSYDGELQKAFSPMSVTITLEDEIDISRGDMIVHIHNLPHVDRHFESMLVWMDNEKMDLSKSYLIKIGTQLERVRLDSIRYKIDVNTLSRENADTLFLNEMGRVVMTATKPIFFDPYKKNRSSGNFVIIDSITNNTVAAGMMLDREPSSRLPSKLDVSAVQKITQRNISSQVTLKKRSEVLHQKPHTIWLTGLISDARTELAYALEKRLFDLCYTCVLLDGRKVRLGLNKELDFTSTDRSEHLRRVAEIARILNDSGLIVICNFISPDNNERMQVEKLIGEARFSEVFVDLSLDWCERNDSTGVYKKARNGEIKNVAGIDISYDKPQNPFITVKPDKEDFEKNINSIINKLNNKIFVK